MAGVVNPSMPVWVARDEATGKTAWCPLNEGSGAVLRYGADGPEVLERLKWMRDVLAPELRTALARGPLDLYDLHVRSLALGDEAHHRTEAGTELTLQALGIEHPEVQRLHRGQRPVLPQPRDGLRQAGAGLRRRRPGLAGPDRDRPQRRRGRDPRLGHRRPLVRRPGRAAGPRQAVRRLHAGRHEPRPRRLRDRRDLRARRAGRRRVAGGSGLGGDRPRRRRGDRGRAADDRRRRPRPTSAIRTAARRSSASTPARSP